MYTGTTINTQKFYKKSILDGNNQDIPSILRNNIKAESRNEYNDPDKDSTSTVEFYGKLNNSINKSRKLVPANTYQSRSSSLSMSNLKFDDAHAPLNWCKKTDSRIQQRPNL